MLIFTPRRSFQHFIVTDVNVLPGYRCSITGGKCTARLRLTLATGSVEPDMHVFYGEEARSVLSQLSTSGFLSAQQADAILAALQIEEEMHAAMNGETA